MCRCASSGFGVRVLSCGEFTGLGTGIDARQSLHPLYRLGDRPLPFGHDRFCKFHRTWWHRAPLAAYPRNALQRAPDELVVLASCRGA